ncbi:MAG: TrmH family RNA methyltransferase [Candidatus Taylorbacteria bacterium]|nr:TrmH family RNA methyltransferase [Candidatus Taylorbacteria bacterium]
MKLTPRNKEVFIVLHNLRSVYNVGSIFRTADCLDVSAILLTGLSPLPVDRFGRWRKDFAKTALGAERTVAWKHFPRISQALRFLKSRQTFIVALEQTANAGDYRKIKPRYPAAFIFGNEVLGIPRAVLKQCDAVAEIVTRGLKESFNVSVAAGIALARILNR